MTLELPMFALLGRRPVHAVATADGGMDVLAYNWQTGRMQRDMSVLGRLLAGGSEVRHVSENEFNSHLLQLAAEFAAAHSAPKEPADDPQT